MTYTKPTLEEFLDTLLEDVLTAETFIDWKRIHDFLEDYRREIALLGSLSRKNPVEDLQDLLIKHPRIILLIHKLLAHDPMGLNLVDLGKINFKHAYEALQLQDTGLAQNLAFAFEKIGLIRELVALKSVADFSKGVLVGLEPNKRKNRRGIIFEHVIIPKLLNQVLRDFNDLNFRIANEIGMKIKVGGRKKYPDFGIFTKRKGEVIAFIEVNFYTSSGSKPEETLKGSYPDLQFKLKDKGIALIVITDGMGWKKMKNGLSVALARLDYLMNYNLARNGKLKEAITDILRK